MTGFIPLKRQVLRLLRGKVSYQDVCDRHWVLCPSESSASTPAIYLDGELDKITAVQEETTHSFEMQLIQGAQMEHAATIAYQLRDVQMLNGCLYKGPLKHPLLMRKAPLLNWGKTEHIPEATLASTFAGDRYFGHWMTDDLTLALCGLAPAVAVDRPLSTHQAEYKNLFNIHPRLVSRAKFDQITFVHDIGQNQFKRERYRHMRSQLAQLGKTQSPRGVMFLRGTSGKRRVLVNEAQVAEFLAKQGFLILDPSQCSAADIVRQTLGAPIIVGVEGSQLVHGLFSMAESGTILTLQPPYRFNNIYKHYTDCLGMKYAFVVGKQVSDGFEIDLDRLAKTLDQVDCFSDARLIAG